MSSIFSLQLLHVEESDSCERMSFQVMNAPKVEETQNIKYRLYNIVRRSSVSSQTESFMCVCVCLSQKGMM